MYKSVEYHNGLISVPIMPRLLTRLLRNYFLSPDRKSADPAF